MSPYQTICRQPFKLNLLARILVFLNYLIYISIFALANLTLLAPEYRLLEDTIYLVGAIVAVNACGSVTLGNGAQFWSAAFEHDARSTIASISGRTPSCRTSNPSNPTIQTSESVAAAMKA